MSESRPTNSIPTTEIKSQSHFNGRAHKAIHDEQLQKAMRKARSGFVNKRQKAIDAIENFDGLRDKALAVRKKSLQHLDVYLEHFEQQVIQNGGQVHWASTPDEMREIVVGICHQQAVKKVGKGKSMVGEEVFLNEALEAAGIQAVETDLGEYIIQLAKERPSHIVAPALHKTRGQIKDLFTRHHDLGERPLEEVEDIVNEARDILRKNFLSADLGVTGANILIAETGTVVVVTNEGNGDLSATLPDTHIVTTSIDKIVPTWEDASAIIRVLARSATGQHITTYTSFFTGPKKPKDKDGPNNFHIVLLDNRRSELLGSEFQEMLHCIRCGACMNHCPVYQSVGGHAYNSVYPGPMGAVLSPLLFQEAKTPVNAHFQLANASTFCGRCESVCPVRIPLPKLMRKLRDKESLNANRKPGAFLTRLFCALASRPVLYRTLTHLGVRTLTIFSRAKGHFRSLPGLGAWTEHRNFPVPQKSTFQAQWRKTHGRD